MGTVTEQHRAVAMNAMKIMGGDARPKVQAFTMTVASVRSTS